jgi:hypothetical protein
MEVPGGPEGGLPVYLDVCVSESDEVARDDGRYGSWPVGKHGSWPTYSAGKLEEIVAERPELIYDFYAESRHRHIFEQAGIKTADMKNSLFVGLDRGDVVKCFRDDRCSIVAIPGK